MMGQGTKRLESRNLILRQFVLEDKFYMYKNWAGDPQVTDYLLWDRHEDIKKTGEVIASWLGNYNRARYYNWAIDKGDGEVIGNISASYYRGIRNTVEVSYCLSRAWWNRGIMTEALVRLIDYFFEEEAITRIQSLHRSDNLASGRVMEKAGLKHEGRLRGFTYMDSSLWDVEIYGMTLDDWKEVRRREC